MIVGALGTRQRAQVRAGGTVVLHEATSDELELTWWIGADDRWHLAETEVTARQSLVRDLPIVSTALRVPSGDAVANAYVAVQGPRELVVMDLDNRSKVPFAVALVVRGAGARDVTLDGSIVRVGGLPLVHLPRSPQRCAVAATDDELRAIVTSGGAGDRYDARPGVSASAFLFPVTHGTSVRVAALLGASNPLALAASPVLSALPTVHEVANGWDVQLGRAARITAGLVDGGVPYRTAVASALLAAEPLGSTHDAPTLDLAVLASTLDLVGLHAEAGALLEDLPDRQTSRGGFGDVETTAHVVDAVCRHGALSHDSVFAESMSPMIAGALEFLLKQSKRDAAAASWLGAAALAPSFFVVGRDRGAAQQVAKRLPVESVLPSLRLPPLPATSAGAAFAPEDVVRLHAIVRSHVEAVVRCGHGGVDVLSGMGPGSYGRVVEARNVPTPCGRLSYAVRWHGERPALLWECVAVHDDQRADDLRLRAPGFDDWSAVGARGDALLPAPTLQR